MQSGDSEDGDDIFDVRFVSIEHEPLPASTPGLPEPGFTEDEEGATLDSGVVLCRFNTLRGGRLQRLLWRAAPLRDLFESTGVRPAPAPPADAHIEQFELVDPQRGALIDHFLPLNTTFEGFISGQYQEFGDFVDGAFRSQVASTGGEIYIGLTRDGEIRAGKRRAEVRIARSASLRPGAADVACLYRIINSSLRPIQILFAVEFNLYAPGLYTPLAMADGYYLVDGSRPHPHPSLGSPGTSSGTTTVALVNPQNQRALQIGWDRECDVWRLPPEEGQASARLVAVWRLQLPPRDNWAMGLWLAPG
jgi:hypothetical protein